MRWRCHYCGTDGHDPPAAACYTLTYEDGSRALCCDFCLVGAMESGADLWTPEVPRRAAGGLLGLVLGAFLGAGVASAVWILVLVP